MKNAISPRILIQTLQKSSCK